MARLVHRLASRAVIASVTKEFIESVIPGRERSDRTRNLEIPGSMLRIAPE
jgi:hypothetical protein